MYNSVTTESLVPTFANATIIKLSSDEATTSITFVIIGAIRRIPSRNPSQVSRVGYTTLSCLY